METGEERNQERQRERYGMGLFLFLTSKRQTAVCVLFIEGIPFARAFSGIFSIIIMQS